MQLIAERILPDELRGSTYVQGEMERQVNIRAARPNAISRSFRHHVYCSQWNAGAAAMLAEVRDTFRGLGLVACVGTPLELEACQCMLLYLNKSTWTSGPAAAQLAVEVEYAMRLGIPLLLAHEMPGIGGQAERGAVHFDDLFECDAGATPKRLLSAGIYHKIAHVLKGGAWRRTSLLLIAKEIVKTASAPVCLEPTRVLAPHPEYEGADWWTNIGSKRAVVSGLMLHKRVPPWPMRGAARV